MFKSLPYSFLYAWARIELVIEKTEGAGDGDRMEKSTEVLDVPLLSKNESRDMRAEWSESQSLAASSEEVCG